MKSGSRGSSLFRNHFGGILVEKSLAISLIAILAIGAVKSFGSKITSSFDGAGNAIQVAGGVTESTATDPFDKKVIGKPGAPGGGGGGGW